MMSNGSAIKQCADCGQTAHTSITCKNGKVGTINLFGVTVNPKGDQVDDIHQLDDDDDGDTVRECKSMEIINLCSNENTFMDHGYYSDEHGHGNGKKKGATWTRKEHKLFLIGLEKLGKGDWKGISKEYVKSRTSTQVASHAQKYFLRVNSPQENGRRRSSLFDMPVNELVPSPIPPPTPIAPPTQVATHTPLAHPTPMAPPTNCVRAPVPRTSQNYGVRDYSYMPLGFPNSNKKPYSHRHFSPTVSFLPVMSFRNQNCAYPYNANWNQRFITLSPVTHPPPITQGEPMIIEVIDDDE